MYNPFSQAGRGMSRKVERPLSFLERIGRSRQSLLRVRFASTGLLAEGPGLVVRTVRNTNRSRRLDEAGLDLSYFKVEMSRDK
jgi:hypothetical protein